MPASGHVAIGLEVTAVLAGASADARHAYDGDEGTAPQMHVDRRVGRRIVDV